MMRFQRRQRTTFTKHQLDALNEAFKRNHYPETQFRDYLAKTTNLDPSRIQVWFQNQRAKDRKRRGQSSGGGGGDDVSPLNGHHSPSALLAPSHHLYPHHQTLIDPQSHNQQHRPPVDNIDDDRLQTNQASSTTSTKTTTTTTTRKIFVFSSSVANEAALAVNRGKYENIVDYHRDKYGNESTLNTLYTNNNVNHPSTPIYMSNWSSSSLSTMLPQLTNKRSTSSPSSSNEQASLNSSSIPALPTNKSTPKLISHQIHSNQTNLIEAQLMDTKHNTPWRPTWRTNTTSSSTSITHQQII